MGSPSWMLAQLLLWAVVGSISWAEQVCAASPQENTPLNMCLCVTGACSDKLNLQNPF